MKRKDAIIEYITNRMHKESFFAYILRLLTFFIFFLHLLFTIFYLAIHQRGLIYDVVGAYTVETVIAVLLSVILGVEFTF
tara:strand:+ start:954 stop:1193 length:240 start_codon:yes stop_codon:yes gene_type:complete